MSRDDLVRTNVEIVKAVSQQIKQHAPDAFVIVVSNPLDVMCWVPTTAFRGETRDLLGHPAHHVERVRYHDDERVGA